MNTGDTMHSARDEQPPSGQAVAPPHDPVSLSVSLLSLAVLTSSWNALSVGGLQPVDLILALTAFASIPLLVRGREPMPGWILVGAYCVVLAATLTFLFPASNTYIQHRAILGGIPSTAGSDPIIIAGKWLIALMVLPWLTVRMGVGDSTKSLTIIARAWSLGAGISAAVAATDYLGLTSLSQSLLGYSSITGREAGLGSHPNTLGFACAMAIPVAVHWAQSRIRIGLALMTLLLFGVLLSGSRGAQVGSVLAILLCFLLLPASRRVFPYAIGMGLIASAYSVTHAGASIDSKAQLLRFGGTGGATASDAGRAIIAEQAARDFAHNPIWGLGFQFLTYSHSIYLQLLASGGSLLLGGMAFYFVSALRAGWTQRETHRSLTGILTMCTIIWLIMGVIQNQLTDRYLYVPIACLASVQAALGRRASALRHLENSWQSSKGIATPEQDSRGS